MKKKTTMSSRAASTVESRSNETKEPIPVGEQVRELRKAKGMTIAELAGLIGRSVGYVSQIERNRSIVSIPTLTKLSDVLGVQNTWFFQGNAVSLPSERYHIVRKNQRRRLNFIGAGTLEELLSPNLSGEIELILSTFDPGYNSGEEPINRDTEEAGLILSGTFELWINDKHFDLREGDSFKIGRNDTHQWKNSGPDKAVVVWVITPPTY